MAIGYRHTSCLAVSLVGCDMLGRVYWVGGSGRCRRVSDHWFGGFQQRSANTAGVWLRAADCDGSNIELVPRLTCPAWGPQSQHGGGFGSREH